MKYDGYLFAKLDKIGTKSEGPVYYLQLFDNKDVCIKKKSELWENDPVLHNCLGKKVTITGTLKNNKLVYDSITLLEQTSTNSNLILISGEVEGINIEKAVENAIQNAPPPPGMDILRKFELKEINFEIGGIAGVKNTIVKIREL
jgi:hypothetical protein